MALAFVWQNTITLGSAIVGIVLAVILVGGFVWLVVRAQNREKELLNQITSLQSRIEVAEGNADSWHDERDLFKSQAERLTSELNDLKVQSAQAETAHAQEMATHTAEQTELRHDLKHQVDLLNLKTDQTPVFEGLKAILERMNSAESSGVATVAQLLEGMEERAAKRDAAIIETQERLAVGFDKSNALLERLTEKIADRVGEVVQEKVDQLQTDAPSPDRKG